MASKAVKGLNVFVILCEGEEGEKYEENWEIFRNKCLKNC